MSDLTFDRSPRYNDTRAAQLCDIGTSLRRRFDKYAELSDIQYAVMMTHLAAELTPAKHPGQPWRLYELGAALGNRFQRLGKLTDNERSIAAYQHAVELTHEGHPLKPVRLNGLGVALLDRFRHLGQLDDLEHSITVKQRAVELTPERHPEKAARLQNLGISLLDRFQHLGELADLEHSITAMQSAVELTPEGHPDKAARLQGLGASLSDRFRHLGELEDLESSITVKQRAVELTPEGHPQKAARLQNLGASLRDRFRHFRELDDLEHAIIVKQRAVELTPQGHPKEAVRLQSLGASLLDRFRHLGELEDLEHSITVFQSAVELTPEGHPDKASRLQSLGISLLNRFRHLGELVDLEQSITVTERAVELTPEGHPDKTSRIISLGYSLRYKFWLEPNKADFDAALDCFMNATTQSVGKPAERWDAAQQCEDLLVKYLDDFGSTELVLLAHSRSMEVLPEIIWLGHSINRRYQECAKYSDAISTAICVAIYCQAFPQAIEWLEAGRSFVWSQILTLNAPLDDLQKQHPALAGRFDEVSKMLRRSEHSSQPSNATPTLSLESTDDVSYRHRQRVIRYDQILKEIRSCEGFDTFMTPPKLSSLLPALKGIDGQIVFLHTDAHSCNALVLCADGTITHIPLSDLTLKRAQQLRSLWMQNLARFNTRARRAMAPERNTARGGRSIFGRILGRLWTWIVQPILQHLKLIKKRRKILPHLTWCPTGPLTQLPLHAAGIYDASLEEKPRIFDFVVSSYTPSLSAILQRQHPGRQLPRKPRFPSASALLRRLDLAGSAGVSSLPNLLMVAQPATPGLSPLPGTQIECARIRAALPRSACTLLGHDQAVVDSTLAIIDQYPWVHLACHGKQDPDDPIRSAFALYDGPLTLSALMSTVSENAELAFLSACQTAVGDEKIPEESAHLAAGMMVVGFKGVIATMWSIGDEDAPIVAEAYYKKLIELRSSGAYGKGGATGAAYALHEAVRVLREEVGEENIVKWAPFVHFGV